jgi:hypothetical protein
VERLGPGLGCLVDFPSYFRMVTSGRYFLSLLSKCFRSILKSTSDISFRRFGFPFFDFLGSVLNGSLLTSGRSRDNLWFFSRDNATRVRFILNGNGFGKYLLLSRVIFNKYNTSTLISKYYIQDTLNLIVVILNYSKLIFIEAAHAAYIDKITYREIKEI